ncbi:hypothetical protein [Thermococcus aciditolerans]|uniref:Uncharacterized protein n=1 Tax=Thermococcus aciditolerans TaxID=2598455 RepID=A0A5C0SJZ0_9EURY|nr:hypothetical protein [Thermococcus aciditolerans]QEK14037.1 hypothetical protein FPV09_01655 [Thermococcus aciditolerans]
MLDSTPYIVPSRILLLSFTPFRDYDGVVHSGEAEFLVEPLDVKISVFIPVGEQAEKLSKLEGQYVDIDIDPPYFEAFNVKNAWGPLITLEPPDSEVPAPRYRLVGLFKIFEPEWGIFECGNLRFPIQGWLETQNGKAFFVRDALRIDLSDMKEWPRKPKPVKSAWVELRKVRFYSYVLEDFRRVKVWKS